MAEFFKEFRPVITVCFALLLIVVTMKFVAPKMQTNFVSLMDTMTTQTTNSVNTLHADGSGK